MDSNAAPVSTGPSVADVLVIAGVALDCIAITLLWGPLVALLMLGLALIAVGVMRACSE